MNPIRKGRLFADGAYTDEREWVEASVYEQLRQEFTLAEKELANYHQEALRLHEQIGVLQGERKHLRDAVEAHQRAVCDNPKAAGQEADERLWSVLHPRADGA